MKRYRSSSYFGGSAVFAFSVASILMPGCDDFLSDPQAFFAENPCNLFNCDTLSFLDAEHDESGVVAEHDETDTADAG